MSKKKKRRRQPKNPPLSARDRHHCCFPKNQDWGKGTARAICQAFVRPVPVVYHRELHTLISRVPVPDEQLLIKALREYQQNKEQIDKYDIRRALAWLYTHIPDPEFRQAIQFQLNFFTERLGQSK